MTAVFDREALLDAFDQIGRAAVEAGTKQQIAVYGGSALMLASNFRFATEDVDVSRLERPPPAWLATIVREIADKNGWNFPISAASSEKQRFLLMRRSSASRG